MHSLETNLSLVKGAKNFFVSKDFIGSLVDLEIRSLVYEVLVRERDAHRVVVELDGLDVGELVARHARDPVDPAVLLRRDPHAEAADTGPRARDARGCVELFR